MSCDTKIFGLGKTYYGNTATVAAADYGKAVHLEGAIRVFKDYSSLSYNGGPGVLRSQRDVTAILVRNVSTVKLLPGFGVSFKTGYRGRRVDGYSSVSWAAGSVAASSISGIVDPFLPASGVNIGELFWLIVKGPVLAKMTGTAVGSVTEGMWLHAATFATSTARTTTVQAACDEGAVIPALMTNASTLISAQQIASRVAVAMSAVTSQSTGADILIDLQLLY